jgi:hypothetical protein
VSPAGHWRFQVDHLALSEVAWDAAGGGRLVRLNDRRYFLEAPER